jgi:hypothetical protein
MLGPMLTTIHNLHYYLNLMREVREALDAGRFAAFARSSGPTAPAGSENRWVRLRPQASAFAEGQSTRTHRPAVFLH